MYELHNYRFTMFMRGGCKSDIWGLSGNAFGNPRLDSRHTSFVSCPVEYDHENEIVTTTSGSKYKLVNPAAPKDEIVKEILDVIERGGYSLH